MLSPCACTSCTEHGGTWGGPRISPRPIVTSATPEYPVHKQPGAACARSGQRTAPSAQAARSLSVVREFLQKSDPRNPAATDPANITAFRIGTVIAYNHVPSLAAAESFRHRMDSLEMPEKTHSSQMEITKEQMPRRVFHLAVIYVLGALMG